MIKTIKSRKSIRTYDDLVKITRNELIKMIELAVYAPSSQNLQPWRFLILDNVISKERIKPYIYGNLSQIDTSSALVVLFSDLDKELFAKKIFDSSLLTMSPKMIEKQLERINTHKKRKTITESIIENTLDIGLVSMNLMLVAQSQGFDSCAIGGFVRNESIAKEFGLDEKRFIPTLIISLGVRKVDGHSTIRLIGDDIIKFA